jgi:hypothetical protein
LLVVRGLLQAPNPSTPRVTSNKQQECCTPGLLCAHRPGGIFCPPTKCLASRTGLRPRSRPPLRGSPLDATGISLVITTASRLTLASRSWWYRRWLAGGAFPLEPRGRDRTLTGQVPGHGRCLTAMRRFPRERPRRVLSRSEAAPIPPGDLRDNEIVKRGPLPDRCDPRQGHRRTPGTRFQDGTLCCTSVLIRAVRTRGLVDFSYRRSGCAATSASAPAPTGSRGSR